MRVDQIGFPAKPVGVGHNKPHMTCHHWALHRLTCAEYEDLRAFANGKCGVCQIPEAETWRGFLVIDHFHSRSGNGEFIRGMLCDWCNQSVMQCIDGLKAWNPLNREWEESARQYEAEPWEQPTEEALRLMAARQEVPRTTPNVRVPTGKHQEEISVRLQIGAHKNTRTAAPGIHGNSPS